MFYRLLADSVVIIHLAFVLFVIGGGWVGLKWRPWAYLHVPAVLWAALIELAGWTCPLTPLENWLRRRGGAGAYETDFIEHYFLPILYPPALTRSVQITLGILVLALNLVVYGLILKRWRSAGPGMR